MRQPSLKNIRVNRAETKKIRELVASTNRVKITVNVDENVLTFLKKEARETGIPYQNLLNRLLLEAIYRESSQQGRIESLEKEIKRLKRKVASL